ncbi:hypothetical protein GCM10027053_22260 [Intrasporangium mesophilum]
MTIGRIAATATTVVFAAVTLVLGYGAMRAHGERVAVMSKADRALSIGDAHGHKGATTHALLLRRQVRVAWLATAASMVVMITAAVMATQG